MKPLNIVVYDYETGSRNPYKTQPIQLAAIAIDGRTLEPIKGGIFNSLMRAYTDEECEAYGLNPLEDEALAKNGKKREDIFAAPAPKLVWKDFCDFVDSYSTGKGAWSAPVCAGFNNTGFDDIITYRLCGGNKQGKSEPYGFGPFDEKNDRCKLFCPGYTYDVQQMAYTWLRSRYFPHNYLSLDNLREYLGMSLEGAHDGLVDCYDTAEILVRFLRLHAAVKVQFEGACAKGRLITR
jgi:DNA polymerase III epsilon subunit-like protein